MKLSLLGKPGMRSKRIILDTNLWISFLITRRLDFLDDLLLTGIFSKELIEEFLTISQRPKFEKYFSTNNITDLLRLFDKYGKLIEVSSSIRECRDIKDDFLLSLAVDSKADYLITGDADLLILKRIKNTKIINWTEFIEKLK